jgi:hypothetical protein
VLVVQVHGQALAVAGAAVQDGLAQEHEAHARHAFQAFAAGGDQRVERTCGRRSAARRKELIASTIRPLPCAFAHIGHLLQRVLTPAPVSQWISTTWVMLASALSCSSSTAGDTGSSSAKGHRAAPAHQLVSLAARLQ